MTSKELNLKLLTLLPEIKDLYDNEVSWQEGDETGSHTVFSDVWFPYILKNLDNAAITKKTSKSLKSFLNYMMTMQMKL